ncbi:hypothetical protein JR316_0006929 [Psilocybe cubensis]|uniref:Uncharacterized protein n=2 Tax=Psilocybe cubensis TaxID=181762 RepID=A0ACB8GXM5_PSICU|nr:hypothetical protein JR316_0006929 [Psilocybe cubensis]KAH9480331.1 hypothetical protein JR316_0006929 [Psilocybe cubensis]
MLFRNGSLSRRDALLLLIGASSMHVWSVLFGQPSSVNDQSIVINTNVQDNVPKATVTAFRHQTRTKLRTKTETVVVTALPTPTTRVSTPVLPFDELPSTELLAHAPGWTLFRNLYMSNGTLYIVADDDARKSFPEIRMMTSTGLEAENTPENIAMREPTDDNMAIISPEEANRRWVLATSNKKGQHLNRVWTVEGNTLLFNDPRQFLRHYYHFVAELFFGAQAFWHGAFSPPITPTEMDEPDSLSSVHFSTTHPPVPPMHRAIFAHSDADGWRDSPGFNSYFLRAALPSLIVEHIEDWNDRITATATEPGEPGRAWHFPIVLLVDRSASHRGWMCGSNTQRTASEAWDFMRKKVRLRGLHVGGWWAPLREAVWRFAGAKEGVAKLTSGNSALVKEVDGTQKPLAMIPFLSEEAEVRGMDANIQPADIVDVGASHQNLLPLPEKIVISYISRQSARNRKLIKEDHERMVKAIQELVARKNKERSDFLTAKDGLHGQKTATGDESVPLAWEFNELIAEHMTKDEQVQAAARTTIMLGVHGNGLTHLVFMDPNRFSTVIEIFYPGGFAHDYYWTSRALGMRHFAFWKDRYRTYPDKPDVDYPEGFQGNFIPVDGAAVAQLIEDRIAGKI